jgi:hypothetical protein
MKDRWITACMSENNLNVVLIYHAKSSILYASVMAPQVLAADMRGWDPIIYGNTRIYSELICNALRTWTYLSYSLP